MALLRVYPAYGVSENFSAHIKTPQLQTDWAAKIFQPKSDYVKCLKDRTSLPVPYVNNFTLLSNTERPFRNFFSFLHRNSNTHHKNPCAYVLCHHLCWQHSLKCLVRLIPLFSPLPTSTSNGTSICAVFHQLMGYVLLPHLSRLGAPRTLIIVNCIIIRTRGCSWPVAVHRRQSWRA